MAKNQMGVLSGTQKHVYCFDQCLNVFVRFLAGG